MKNIIQCSFCVLSKASTKINIILLMKGKQYSTWLTHLITCIARLVDCFGSYLKCDSY